jgi:hypothetical protein
MFLKKIVLLQVGENRMGKAKESCNLLYEEKKKAIW